MIDHAQSYSDLQLARSETLSGVDAERLASHPDSLVRGALALNGKIGMPILARLDHDPDGYVRACCAQREARGGETTICVAGQNRIAIDAIRWIIAGCRYKRLIAIFNASDDGIDRWQPSFRKFVETIGCVEKLTLDSVKSIDDMVFVSVEFDQILRPKEFKTSRIYNIHFSLLPAYKGMYTSCHPILRGEEAAGCTVHEIDAGIDTGAIIAQCKFELSPEETAKTLYAKFTEQGSELLRYTLPMLIAGRPRSYSQDSMNSTYFSKRSIDYRGLEIDIKQTAFQVQRQIRAFTHRSYQMPKLFGKPISRIRITAIRSVAPAGTLIECDSKEMLISSIDYDFVAVIDRFDTLIDAARNDDSRVAEEILSLDPALISESDKNGWTPLIVASYCGSGEVVKFLLSLGADVNYGNNKGTTPLMYAKDAYFRSKDPQVFQTLIDNGADLSRRDIYDRDLEGYLTPEQWNELHSAADSLSRNPDASRCQGGSKTV